MSHFRQLITLCAQHNRSMVVPFLRHQSSGPIAPMPDDPQGYQMSEFFDISGLELPATSFREWAACTASSVDLVLRFSTAVEGNATEIAKGVACEASLLAKYRSSVQRYNISVLMAVCLPSPCNVLALDTLLDNQRLRTVELPNPGSMMGQRTKLLTVGGRELPQPKAVAAFPIRQDGVLREVSANLVRGTCAQGASGGAPGTRPIILVHIRAEKIMRSAGLNTTVGCLPSAARSALHELLEKIPAPHIAKSNQTTQIHPCVLVASDMADDGSVYFVNRFARPETVHGSFEGVIRRVRLNVLREVRGYSLELTNNSLLGAAGLLSFAAHPSISAFLTLGSGSFQGWLTHEFSAVLPRRLHHHRNSSVNIYGDAECRHSAPWAFDACSDKITPSGLCKQ